MYWIKHLTRKFWECYGAEGSKVRLTLRVELREKVFLEEEANNIVTDIILDSSFGAAAKIVKESLRDDQGALTNSINIRMTGI